MADFEDIKINLENNTNQWFNNNFEFSNNDENNLNNTGNNITNNAFDYGNFLQNNNSNINYGLQAVK